MGMKHSGKTTLGRLISERTGIPFRDLDDLLEERALKNPGLFPQE